jgi:chromosome partitioning protein
MDDSTKRTVWAVVNLKGGTGKTTTAVFLAHALHEQGRRVLLVDADPQGSATSWLQDAPEPFPFAVIGMATKDLHRQLPDVVNSRIDAVVIDTPPLDKGSGVVLSALRAASVVVVPVAPTPMEYKRLAPVAEIVADSAGLRADGWPPKLAVLLNRTIPNASSTMVWRQQIEADGMWCLHAEVRRLERYSQAYGDNIINALGSSFGDAVSEILGATEKEVTG